jgi:hypothetical protein
MCPTGQYGPHPPQRHRRRRGMPGLLAVLAATLLTAAVVLAASGPQGAASGSLMSRAAIHAAGRLMTGPSGGPGRAAINQPAPGLVRGAGQAIYVAAAAKAATESTDSSASALAPVAPGPSTAHAHAGTRAAGG